jgi:hypothetical protein
MLLIRTKSAAQKRQQIERLAESLNTRSQRKAQAKNQGQEKRGKPLARKETRPRPNNIIAYDLETTRIQKGTPKALYITAYGNEGNFQVSRRIKSLPNLLEILQDNFLLPELSKSQFCAWNGNGYDVFFIAAALLHCPDYEMKPYLTGKKNLRGLKVILKSDPKNSYWEFLDGIAMTGIVKPLKSFLQTFAPEYQKLEAPNWETQEFDYRNRKHVEYAERDSEGLYYALIRAQNIVHDNFNQNLRPTIGNLGIRIFQANIPVETRIWGLNTYTEKIVRDYVTRGGFCFCQRKYQGPIWKYDINQAYAAAMRDADLPAGSCKQSKKFHPYAKAAIYRITATKKDNIIPFYYRDLDSKKSVFGINVIENAWLTIIEYNQLINEGWNIQIHDGYIWDETFRMKQYVDCLEDLRVGQKRDPKSAQGEMVKAIGNNSFGKTLEQNFGLDFKLAAEQPEDYHEYPMTDDEAALSQLGHIWYQFIEPLKREYHKPHIGAFITAHVRMVVRRAALLKPDAWIYADTDCVAFSEPVNLPISNTQYGLWKIEVEGDEYRFITKKVYCEVGGTDRKAKGLNIRHLNDEDFQNWFEGRPPEQTQVQRQNFLKVMSGFEMFVERKRIGQRM